MSQMPADAQRSDDGQWWWDGSQWQPVASQTAGGATTATAEQQATAQATGTAEQQGTATGAASGAVGQLSEDGQWQWDGSQWQPAQTAQAAAAPASGAATGSGRQVTLGTPTAEAHAAHDGTMEAVISYSITNTGTIPIDAPSLLLTFLVAATGRTAETLAYVTGDMPVALAVGEVHNGHGRLQIDPGSWTVSVVVNDAATGDVLATSDNVTLEVAGHQANAPLFDDTQTYALTLRITNVELVQDSMYRVHYDVESDRDVPAGLQVVGRVLGLEPASSSSQMYDLTSPITAGRSHPHYLTLGADSPSHTTMSIVLDPGGPSETSESVVVDISEDGTPTMSR